MAVASCLRLRGLAGASQGVVVVAGASCLVLASQGEGAQEAAARHTQVVPSSVVVASSPPQRLCV